MRYFAASDTGQKRSENQDAFCVFEIDDAVIGIIADGMGGHKGGSTASRMARDCVKNRLATGYRSDLRETELMQLLKESYLEANNTIFFDSIKNESLYGMGTTLTTALIRQGRVLVIHIGDSRGYLIERGTIRQLTRDQTYVQQLLDTGEITPQQAENHPQRHVIMQAVGVGTSIQPELLCEDYTGGSVLLCSDGLSNMVSDAEILSVVDSFDDPKKKVAALIDRANAAGGLDNISAVLIDDFEMGGGKSV